MTMKIKYSKRILAVAVALVMLLGTLFTGAVSATADSLTDGLTHIATAGRNECKYPTESTITDIQGGGIKFETNNQIGAYAPYAQGNLATESTGAFPGDGISLQFNNYVSDPAYATAENYRKFMVVLAQRTGTNSGNYYRLGAGVGAILVDTQKGQMSFIIGKADGNINQYDIACRIASSDALKYDNFTGKAFTIDFAKGATGGIDVAIKVGGKNIAGNIPQAKFDLIASGKKPYDSSVNNTWITVSTAAVSDGSQNGKTKDSFEYYGFKGWRNRYHSRA